MDGRMLLWKHLAQPTKVSEAPVGNRPKEAAHVLVYELQPWTEDALPGSQGPEGEEEGRLEAVPRVSERPPGAAPSQDGKAVEIEARALRRPLSAVAMPCQGG